MNLSDRNYFKILLSTISSTLGKICLIEKFQIDYDPHSKATRYNFNIVVYDSSLAEFDKSMDAMDLINKV